MKPTHTDLCEAVVIIGSPWDDEPVSDAVIHRLAELELVEDSQPKLTAAGERLYAKIEAGDDIAEFGLTGA